MLKGTEVADDLRVSLAECLTILVTITEAAARLGLDMRAETKPIVDDAAKALGIVSPVDWPARVAEKQHG